MVQLHVLEVIAVALGAADNIVGGRARAEELVEVTSSHVLEQEAHGPADGAHGQQFDDVGVFKLGQQAGFALKVLSEVLGRLVLQHFDCYEGELLTLDETWRLSLRTNN